jgi:hypothetical protein
VCLDAGFRRDDADKNMFLTRYFQKYKSKKPYQFLPLAVFAFYGLCFLLHPLSPLRTGQLADPDDYMRLDEVINWLQGQGWFDVTQPRMAPNAHTVIHWSRLVDLPIAFVMLPFIPMLGLPSAAMIASWIVPPVLFGMMLCLAVAMARVFVTDERANMAAPLLLFAPALLFNFTPGRVDHHAYQILIAGCGIYCLSKILQSARDWPYAVAAAIAFACGLWIGTEALPWLLLFILCLSYTAAWNGGFALRTAAIFGAAFATATTVLLFAALPSADFNDRALSWFSFADIILAALTACVFLLFWLIGRLTHDRFLRLALLTVLGSMATLAFVVLVPDILSGPFASYDTFNSTIALDNISEAQPLGHAFWIDHYNPLTWQRALNAFIHTLFLPLLALGAVGYNLHNKKNKSRQLWLIQGVFMELFTLAPLTWLLVQSWMFCGKRLKNRQRFGAECAFFMLLGPLPVLLLPSLFDPATLYRDIVLFPAARTADSCNLKAAADFMGERYGLKNLTLMTGMNEGPEILFRTPYNVIGGNYNVSGNPDVFRFFRARDEANAENILHKWHADLVLTCRNIAPFLAGFDHAELGRTAYLQPQSDGKLHLVSSRSHPTLIERLVNGKPPDWLKPVEIPGNSDYLLFEVQKGTEAK